MGLVNINNATITYKKHPAVHHLSGSFEMGSMTAVVGPNGSGKTTLLKGILGLKDVSEGAIKLEMPKEKVAYLPQSANIDRSFPINVCDLLFFGFFEKTGVFGRITKDMKERAEMALTSVGLKGFEKRTISTLSSGQFQRVLFARAMLQDAKLIILDEPFNAIDAKTTADLLELMHRWHDEKKTIIAVLHDIEQVKNNFPETLLIAREKIAWGPTKETLSAENLLKARRMMEAWNEGAPHCEIHNH